MRAAQHPLHHLMAPALLTIGLCFFGCGSVEETTENQDAEVPVVSKTAQLDYRIDSLMTENRRYMQQVDAIAAENRNLAARNTELEGRVRELMAATPPPPPPPSAPQAEVSFSHSGTSSGYSAALDEFRSRNFAGAVADFGALLNSGIGDNLADNCHYWIGESYYGMRKYDEAIKHFGMVLDYKRSEKTDEAQLMIGNSYSAMGDKAGAKEAYNRLISEYPASPFVRKAEEKLAKLH